MDDPCAIGPLNPCERRKEAYHIRKEAARDEELYPNKIGNYSKGLPHNSIGKVDCSAYRSLIAALKSGKPSEFESILLGGTLKLINPQAAYVYDLVGPDSHSLVIPAAPRLNSSWAAGEMVELYWQSLTRDIPFANYDVNPQTIAAAKNLSSLTDFRGPKIDGTVTPGILFCGNTPGTVTGPYISQFLYQDIPFGAITIPQRCKSPVPNINYLTDYSSWLNIQNGLPPTSSNVYKPLPNYITTGRDLTAWVHQDFSYQFYLTACLYLLSLGPDALDKNNPYLHSQTQSGFVTFGTPYILDLVARAANFSLESAWYQKFLVHRRLRPEEFGGLVQNQLTNVAKYPINKQLLSSPALTETYKITGTFLLPQAYPEGCPAHPSYPSGHACMAGACVTLLKAFFDEDYILPNPVIPDSSGLSLLPYNGAPLTIGGELNKLATNISLGRNWAGIHYRSDGFYGMNLGEAAAIGLLHNYRHTFNESFKGFKITKFDGTTILVR